MRLTALLALALLVCSFGCESRQEEQTALYKETQAVIQARAALHPLPLLREPIEPTLIEIPGQALPVWRRFREARPALVLVSQGSFLQPVPGPLAAEVGELVEHGSARLLWEKSPFATTNPLLLPDMTVSAAIDAGFFSKLIWVLPVKPESQTKLSLDAFRQQLLGFSAISEAEAATLIKTPGGFSGTLKGLPFQTVFAQALPAIEEPVIVHFDPSYFSSLYISEMKTPLFSLLHQTQSALRDTGWKTLAVTISHSNYGGGLPLASRFMGQTLAALFANPELIDGEMPLLWSLRWDNLYLGSFFQPETVLENAQQMVQLAPEDAATHFDLYQALLLNKENVAAQQALKKAVELDRGYALHYVALANESLAARKPGEALDFFILATEAFPQDPIIALNLGQTYLQMNHTDKAQAIIKELAMRSWSPIYYPAISDQFSLIMEFGKAPAEPPQTQE